MRTAVRQKVSSEAARLRALSAYHFERAGLPVPEDQKQEEQSVANVEAMSSVEDESSPRAVRRAERRAETAASEQSEKSDDQVVAENFLAAAKELEALVREAPEADARAQQVRNELPAYLRRGSVPQTRQAPTQQSQVRSGPPAR